MHASSTGRPCIDPQLLLRILLIGCLYGVTSERMLVEELRMHLAWRWFTGLGFDQEIPHHSTFSKNRHGGFQESKLFEQLFEQILKQCVEVGLVQGKHLSVDGSFVEANASQRKSDSTGTVGGSGKTCSHVSPSGKDERQNRWPQTPRTGTESSRNGWRIGASLLTCEPATVSTERTARSKVQSVFTYEPEHNRHILSRRQPLNYGGRSMRNRSYAYIGTRKRCGACALKEQCTRGAFRFLAIHMDEPARQRVRELANKPEFVHTQRQRKKVEALFAELKNQISDCVACVCGD